VKPDIICASTPKEQKTVEICVVKEKLLLLLFKLAFAGIKFSCVQP
jgi:hypothetical protein